MTRSVVYDGETGALIEEIDDGLPEPVPSSVDMASARLALLGVGITAAQVDEKIALLESPQREAAQIEWEYRLTVRRDSPLVAAIGPMLGLTDEQVDDLFRAAALL